MQFDSLQAFFQMGGHGLYIWSAYAITTIVLVANLLWPLVARKRMLKQAQRHAARQANQQKRMSDRVESEESITRTAT